MKKVAIYMKSNYSYRQLEQYGFEVIRYEDREAFIRSNIRLKVIHEEIEYTDRIYTIKSIRMIHSKLQVGVVNCIQAVDTSNLLEYLELGGDEYLKAPYSIEEMYFILNNKLIVLDEERRFQLTLDNLTFPTWVNDMNGKYLNANQKFADYLKTTSEMVIGKGPENFYGHEEVEKILKQDNEIIATRKTIKFDDSHMEKGKKRVTEVYKTPIIDTYNNIVGITGTIVDVTELKETQEELKKQALTDPLTGLKNRRALYEYIDSNNEKEIGVMLIDVDDFKVINDTYGHNIGDYVIESIANRIKNICKENFVCRLGGDEFLIIFNYDEDIEIITGIAENLCSIDSIEINNIEKYEVSLSIGIAINQVCNKVKDILTKVDLALYKAKENKRIKNKYVIYNSEIEKERKIRLEIEDSIRLNKNMNNFTLYYQPQYDVYGELKGVEALLRWKSEKYKDVKISYIIKILEENGLIVEVGRFIIKEAFEFCNKINKNRKTPLIVSINISAVQIMHKNFVDTIVELIEETNVNPTYLGIEITETTLLKDMKKNIDKIYKLKSMGINILIDDFGVGYSAFNYILELPITTIKIDKSLIELIHINTKYKDLISLIVKFAEKYKLTILGEGVELAEQLQVLKEIGVHYIQGYIFNKPLTEEAIMNIIKLNKV